MEQTPVKCICGANLTPLLVLKVISRGGLGSVYCDGCWKKCDPNDTIFHCSNENKTSIHMHPNSYDLCHECAVINGSPSNRKFAALKKLGYDTEEICEALLSVQGDFEKAKTILHSTRKKEFEKEQRIHELIDCGFALYLRHTEENYATEVLHKDANVSCDIEQCGHLRNVIDSLCTYKTQLDDHDSIHIISSLLDDFLHLMNKHDNDEAFDFIINKIGSCDVNHCNIFRRHYRDREDIHHENVSVQQAIMDKIHCYYLHCYDTGYRLRHKDRLYINKGIDVKEEKNNVDFNSFTRKRKTHNILCDRRKLYSNMDILRRRKTLKFNQFAIEVQHIENNTRYYSFGVEFQYGRDDIMETKTDETDGYIDRIKPIHIHGPKYASLKEELTNNDILTLNPQQFDHEYAKAQVHYSSRYRKQEYMEMSLDQLLCLMIYCNYDVLQNEFSKTYRRIAENESDEQLIEKHQNFYFLAKNIKDVINNVGDVSHRYLYHGISGKFVFPSYLNNVVVNTPLSTTSSLPIAFRFADDGLIIEFEPSKVRKDQDNPCLCLSVSWLSDFSDEKEYLFVQSDGKFWIDNIIDSNSCVEYRVILKALDTIEQEAIAFSDVDDTIIVLSQRIINHRLSHQLPAFYSLLRNLDLYSTEIIRTYFENKTYFQMSFANKVFKELQHKFYKRSIRIPLIHVLCPNVELIHIRGVNLCKFLMYSIRSYLAQNKVKQSNLKCIWIKPIEKSELNIDNVITNYQESFRATKFNLTKIERVGFMGKNHKVDIDDYYLCIKKIGSELKFIDGKTIWDRPHFKFLAYYNPVFNKTIRLPNTLRS